MRWMPTSVGAEPKKLVILGVLVVGAGVAYYVNRTPDAPQASTTPAPAVAPAPPPIPSIKRDSGPPLPMPAKRTGNSDAGATMEDFRPSLKPKEGLDVSKIDPTLRLDLLAKLQQVELSGGSRSLFEFGQPPAPPPPKVAPIKPGALAAAADPPKPVEPAKPPGPPPPPPIPLKFYGYAGKTPEGVSRAFFLDGDAATGEIFVAAENETLKNRYKIIRIGIKSAVVEDTSNKNQQTLPLVVEEGG